MKVITAIYLNCRPELRDEWLAGQDQEVELEDALVCLHRGVIDTSLELTRAAAGASPAHLDPVLQQT